MKPWRGPHTQAWTEKEKFTIASLFSRSPNNVVYENFTAKITQTVFLCLLYHETCKEFVVQKFTLVISTYYYRHIPTLCREVDRTSVLSSVFFTMHLFAICSWVYSFLYIAYFSVLALGNEIEEWNHGLPFRRPAFVYNNKRPVILPFLSF